MDADFGRRGASITDPAHRADLSRVGTLLTELGGSIEQRINEDTTTITLTAEDLDGVPPQTLEGFPRGVGDQTGYIVGMKAPTRLPVMRFAKSQETR